MASDDNYKVELKKDDLQKLLQQELGSDFKVEKFTTVPLTKPGDNYGSTILSVEVFYHDVDNNLQKLPIVAKLVPQSPFLRKFFNIEITFNKEVNAYTLVSPEFQKIQKEKGIPEAQMLDVFAKYFGSRSNRQDDTNAEADESAVLLVENLKISGYEIGDRRKGYNLQHMEFTVTKLAQFHALAVAIKLLKPDVFKKTILKTCEQFYIAIADGVEGNETWINSHVAPVKNIPEIIPYLDKIEQSMRNDTKMRQEKREYPAREPFATIVHNDFWVNNMMFKYDHSNSQAEEKRDCPTGIKFVDFQVTTYGSPVRDLLFVLFSSSEDGLLDKYFDHFIRLYHKEFEGLLARLGCDVQPFSFEHFLEELNVCAPQEFAHSFFMLSPISADSSNMDETSSFSRDDMLQNRDGEVFEKKVKCLVQKFVANGWL